MGNMITSFHHTPSHTNEKVKMPLYTVNIPQNKAFPDPRLAYFSLENNIYNKVYIRKLQQNKAQQTNR